MDNNEYYKQIADALQNWGLQFNARKRFNSMKNSLESDSSYYDNEIFKLMDDFVLGNDSDKFEKVVEENTVLYRAREISIDDYGNENKGLKIWHDESGYHTKGYSGNESKECPLGGISKAGRNNVAGASYLYLASDEATACCEIKTTLRSLISVASFKVNRSLRIIDFATDKIFDRSSSIDKNMSLGRFFTLFMFQYCQPVSDPKDYRVTQILSDYIRKAGYDGVSYKSFYTGGTNYTIFNSHEKNISFVDSRIVSHQYSREIFWDFNNECIIQSDQGDLLYDKSLADDILKDMNTQFSIDKSNDKRG